MNKAIEIPGMGVVLYLGDKDETGHHLGSVIDTSGSRWERTTCPGCNRSDCFFNCDSSQAGDFDETEEEAAERVANNAALDAIESMILAHASCGLDVTTPQYIEGIQTALDAISYNLS